MKSLIIALPVSALLLCSLPAWAQPAHAPDKAAVIAQPKVTQPSPAVGVECPVLNVTVGVKTPSTLPAPWWDTPYIMKLDSVSLTTVSGAPGIRCLYKDSGRGWDIARPVGPEYQSCTPNGKSFLCIPAKGY